MKKMMFLMAMISGIIAISGCEKTPEGPDQKDPVLQTFEVSVDSAFTAVNNALLTSPAFS